MKPLTRAQLDAAGCQMPGCAHQDHTGMTERMFLHGRCHPKEGLEVSYWMGVITVRCKRCKQMVSEIEVAT